MQLEIIRGPTQHILTFWEPVCTAAPSWNKGIDHLSDKVAMVDAVVVEIFRPFIMKRYKVIPQILQFLAQIGIIFSEGPSDRGVRHGFL